LQLSGWSKAETDGGGADRADYSIYVDLEYTDGTSLFGQWAAFRPGPHDWEYAQRVILLEKPVQQFRLYCLFRRRAGKAYFDDIRLAVHTPPPVALATREFTNGFVAANPCPLRTAAAQVALPEGKRYRDLATNATVQGIVLVPARNASVLILLH
jgi:hypothetical protein